MGPDTAGTTETAERDEAFREYVVPELEVLLRVARRLTGDKHLAEDMVQETLLRAYRAIDRFDGRYPLSGPVEPDAVDRLREFVDELTENADV